MGADCGNPLIPKMPVESLPTERAMLTLVCGGAWIACSAYG